MGSTPDDDDARGKHRGPCGNCKGSGTIEVVLDNRKEDETCPMCKGTGLAT